MTFLRSSVLTVCICFIAQVCAISGSIFPRQGALDPNAFPPQCQLTCSEIINNISGCAQDLSCICTSDNENLLKSCVDCVVSADFTLAHQEEGQAELDQFTNECTTAGFPFAHVPVSVSVVPSTAASTATETANIFSQLTSEANHSPTPTQKSPFKNANDASSMVGLRMSGSMFVSLAVVGFMLLA